MQTLSYNALVEGFEEDTEGVEDFLDEVLEVKDINDLVSMKIESSFTAWEGDIEDPEDWEEFYDEVNYDEEMHNRHGHGSFCLPERHSSTHKITQLNISKDGTRHISVPLFFALWIS